MLPSWVAPPGNIYVNSTVAFLSPGFWMDIHSSNDPSYWLFLVVPSERNQESEASLAPTWAWPPVQALW